MATCHIQWFKWLRMTKDINNQRESYNVPFNKWYNPAMKIYTEAQHYNNKHVFRQTRK
jgi:hypothetical protein